MQKGKVECEVKGTVDVLCLKSESAKKKDRKKSSFKKIDSSKLAAVEGGQERKNPQDG